LENPASTQVFRPKEQTGYIPLPHPVAPYDSPDSPFPGFRPPRISRLIDKFEKLTHLRVRRGREQVLFQAPLSVGERRRIVRHPDRISAIDCIDTSWGLFDDSVLLDHISYVNGIHKTSPVISALVQYKDTPLLVLAQQTQQSKNEKGEVQIVYEPIRPADWRATRRFLDFAEKLGLTTLMMGNTSGASALHESEDQGGTNEIGLTTQRVVRQKTPVISLNYGMKGSGGGIPFINTADYAAAWEFATAWVADTPAMRSFIERVRLLDESKATPEEIKDLDAFAQQFHDATAEGQLETFQIDRILREGPGGAHNNPWIVINEMGMMLDEVLPVLERKYRNGILLSDRKARRDRLAGVGAVVNPDYQAEIDEINKSL
jgi:acetyl-CoA carboxylase alpha subunit